MTTATRRLRRTGVAGLAASVTAGVAIIATATSAFAAFSGTTGLFAYATGSSASTLTPGVANQALPSVTLKLTNGTWAAGDFLTFGLSSSATAITPICTTSSNLNASAKFVSTPTVAASDSGGASVGTTTATLEASGGTCNVNDAFQLALPANPGDSGTTTWTISGLSTTLGTAIPAGTVNLTGVASNGVAVPFTGGHIYASVVAGTVATLSVAAASSLGVSASQTNTTIPNITVTDVTGGQITAGLLFTLPGTDTWATLPTLTDPSGVTSSTSSTTGGQSVQYVLTGTTPANGVYTLSGGQVNFSATTGPATITVKTGASPSTTAVGSTQFAFVGAQNRVGGADRYGTAALIFNEAFGTATVTGTGITPAFLAPHKATSVVVTSGTNFPDALSSAYLASSLGTGILLTDPNTLSSSTQQVLINGSVTTVYIVGGTAAVSQNVQNAIAALKNPATSATLNVIRVAGADRYATNEAADLNSGVVGSGSQTAILATGTNFADALAASPAIAAKHYPLILTDPNTLSPSASATIAALGVKNVIIVGGTSAVSTAVETAVKTLGVTILQRLAGADRTLTAQQIATWETQGVAAGNYTALTSLGFFYTSGANVNITNGANFPDALAAGPALATAGTLTGGVPTGEVLLLTTSPTALGAGIPGFLGGQSAHVSSVSAIGLASAVSGSVLAQAGGSIS